MPSQVNKILVSCVLHILPLIMLHTDLGIVGRRCDKQSCKTQHVFTNAE